MASRRSTMQRHLRQQLAQMVFGPPAFAFLPAFCLGAYWFGGVGALIVLAGIVPVFYLLAGSLHDVSARTDASGHGLMTREAFEQHVDDAYFLAERDTLQAATVCVVLEEYNQLVERYGHAAAETVVLRTGERMRTVIREEDAIARLGDARFAICTRPVRHLDLEMCIQLAGRLQSAAEEPVSVDGIGIYASVSIGFCQHGRASGRGGADWLQAAATAMAEAQRNGPSAIRAFSDQMRVEALTRTELREEVIAALEDGQIQPWFQPQISADTGAVTGFEALARWDHPKRGLLAPADFLPAIEDAGQLERLAEVMIYHAFTAVKAWDAAGVNVPQVGVNFAGQELSNPRLVNKIEWELDRFELTPDRLAVEVLETVVANTANDMITRNIKALSELGCRIDLDDFGTGHASIASIRRFSVSRIKIDRSFVMKADRDPEQQRMISAILTMAERLELQTLAEGVETVGEHVLLAQLGCDHVQGFGIGKPMPFDETFEWIAQHGSKLQDMPRIMNNKG